MQWIACELHTHTFHSDGRQTLLELASGAKALGFDCIALTDHNTMTGLQDKEAVELATGVAILPGMEWTTFYGHMVTIGVKTFVDWRPAGPGDIDAGIERVHAQGGLAGLAHPFRIGSPICTGCFWEFQIKDWNAPDYIEVWSGTFPPIKSDNHRAYRLWTDKLNEGFRIAATSGRDWHVQEGTDEPVSVTYLGLEEGDAPVADRAFQALASGRVSVTIGPLLIMEVESGGASYGIGSAVPCAADVAEYRMKVSLDFSARAGKWEHPEQNYSLRILGNTGVLGERSVSGNDKEILMDVNGAGLRWTRAELWGIVRGVRVLIAFTNAVYFDE
ncbi:CehA/McbA family metallohydrolase [Paenibacillus filicis]|uniref:CehA/McbA family metallohydrolase n=1 Tax=Paenibacillus gyeongsangnamensis TaxID=3388067 RepID=A0ABT4Q4R4_9BACL|nr:CehA/McbA family metallohydrolase [Paenibacillus filicis]MCZ8511872.1 CehA/McbA family metallohydrolase [Paenibacillus filicis]